MNPSTGSKGPGRRRPMPPPRARRAPVPRNAPPGPPPPSRVRATVRRAGSAARSYARNVSHRYGPRRTPVFTVENFADAAAAIVGGVGTAVLGGLAANKWDERIAGSVLAVAAGTTSMAVQKGGWRTLLQGVASASAGQAALAILADSDKPLIATKSADATNASTRVATNTKPADKAPATATTGTSAKRNAMPSSAMERAFARSEARIAQILADDGGDA